MRKLSYMQGSSPRITVSNHLQLAAQHAFQSTFLNLKQKDKNRDKRQRRSKVSSGTEAYVLLCSKFTPDVVCYGQHFLGFSMIFNVKTGKDATW